MHADRPSWRRTGRQRWPAALPNGLLEDALLLKDFPRDAERFDTRRDTGIDRDLNERVADFLRGAAVAERAPNMKLEFGAAVQRGDHPEIVQAALLIGQNGPRPHLAPAVLGAQPLKIAVEVIDGRRRLVDVRVAKNLPTHRHAVAVSLLVHQKLARKPSCTTRG